MDPSRLFVDCGSPSRKEGPGFRFRVNFTVLRT